MKKRKMVKRIFCMFMAICMTMSVPMLSAKAAGNYTTDWQRWSQGASGYAAMQYGCRVTAYSKMLAEAGYTGFGNPDGFFDWGKGKGYFRASDTRELTSKGAAPVEYVNTYGGTASKVGEKALTGNKVTDANTVMNMINQGYYVVLTCSSHSVYVGRAESISQGTAVVLESLWGVKVGSSIQYRNYTRYTFEYAVYFKITNNSAVPSIVTFDDEGVTNLTDTNATISTWVNNTGSITERGFYIGMSDEYQNKVVVGTEPVEWTRFHQEYNIADYYGELTPGIRYTYVFYVKKGDEEYHSSVGHFTTSGSADIMFDTYGLNNISEDSAYISTWFSNPNGYKISSLGFSIGEDFKSLKQVEVFRDIGWTRAEPKCEIKDYVGELKPSTNYVARFYITINSRTYYSDYICFFTIPPTVTFDSVDVSNLTNTNAIISTWVNNTGSITERGFYIGMSDEYQNKVVVGTEPVEWTRFHQEYNIADYYGELTPGIRYTYVFYVKKGDKEYHSSVGHFTTTGNTDISFDTYGLNNISEDSASVSTWFSNSNGYTISSYGFLIGESFKTLKKVEVFSDIGWTRAETKCEIKDYAGELKASTNYVVRFYVAIGSQTYYSDYITFSTVSAIEDIEKEHIWNEGIVTNEATCTEEGVKIFTCTNCEETRKEIIPAKGHVRKYYTNNDGTHSATCSNCGETEVTNCSYDKTVTEPTCKMAGYTTYICRDCGYSYEDDFVDCIEHSFTNYVSDNNAQISADGTKTAYCDYGCGTTDTVVDEGSALETEQPGKEEPEKPSTTYTYKLNDDKTTITITKYTASDENVAIPSSIDGYAVTGIDEKAFQNITTMKTISFPSSLKSIGNYAFAGCTSLTMVTLPESLTELGNYAFQGCVALQSAKLNAGWKNVSEGLFQGCSSLSSVTLPNSVQYIRPNAFSGCTSLKTLSLPKSLSIVYANAFLNSGIKVIQYAGTNTDWQNVTIGTTGNTSFLNAAVTDSNGKTFSANKSKWNTSSPAPVKKPSVSKVRSFKAKAGKKKLTLTWNKISGAVGYQIQISTKKNFKGAKTISIFSSKKTYTKKSLKAKKKYYIRVRAYKTYKDANKKTQKVYGKWTTISKKTK